MPELCSVEDCAFQNSSRTKQAQKSGCTFLACGSCCKRLCLLEKKECAAHDKRKNSNAKNVAAPKETPVLDQIAPPTAPSITTADTESTTTSTIMDHATSSSVLSGDKPMFMPLLARGYGFSSFIEVKTFGFVKCIPRSWNWDSP